MQAAKFIAAYREKVPNSGEKSKGSAIHGTDVRDPGERRCGLRREGESPACCECGCETIGQGDSADALHIR
jgi:hypothetical protein